MTDLQTSVFALLSLCCGLNTIVPCAQKSFLPTEAGWMARWVKWGRPNPDILTQAKYPLMSVGILTRWGWRCQACKRLDNSCKVLDTIKSHWLLWELRVIIVSSSGQGLSRYGYVSSLGVGCPAWGDIFTLALIKLLQLYSVLSPLAQWELA